MRVIIADDSMLFREGLSRILESEEATTVVATAADALDLKDAINTHDADIVVTDIRMPPTHTTEGLEAALDIKASFPQIGVLVLSHHVESHYALQLLGDDPSGVGYLLKDRVDDLDEFLASVRRVANGGSVIDPLVVSRMMQRKRKQDPLERLSAREREVLALLAEGRSNQAIAARLHVTEKTIQTHVASILAKLDIHQDADDHRRILAVLTYLRAINNSREASATP
ncbi:MAG: response regulator transcription factor [Actinobacteria bacterium]|nr:response regulator transcription factor [Actinomycetota bacterium]